jgi:hypothetical protein
VATLALLTQGHNKLFTPPVGRIPDGVIENRKATKLEKDSNKKLAQDYAQAGFGWQGREWKCLLSLWTSESRFDNYAVNRQGSSAYGIAQLLGEKDNRPEYQILRGLKYISKRYDTPCRALQFHKRYNHY